MNFTELSLSEILENPRDYEEAEIIAMLFTDEPLDDFARGWSYAGEVLLPAEQPLEVLAMHLEVEKLKDLDGVLFDIKKIRKKIKRKEVFFEGENILLKIADTNNKIWNAPLDEIHKLLEKDVFEKLYSFLLIEFGEKTRLTIEYDEKQRGWFLAEFGLIACRGYNFIEALCILKDCQDVIGQHELFKYILAFYPSSCVTPSDSLNDCVFACRPDHKKEFYVIDIDTDLDEMNCDELLK